jgi:hypothetical protein
VGDFEIVDVPGYGAAGATRAAGRGGRAVKWKLLEVVSRDEQIAARANQAPMSFQYAQGGYTPSFAHPNSPARPLHNYSIQGLSANYVIYDEAATTDKYTVKDYIEWTTDYIAKRFGKHQ